MPIIDSEPTDFDYHQNKKTDRIYLSKLLENKSYKQSVDKSLIEIIRPARILSKVLESAEAYQFTKEGKEVVLRITPGGRQEIIAKFFEESRQIFVLQIQKYSVKTGFPHEINFSFVGDEIRKLYNFIRNVALIPIKGPEGEKFDDKYLEEIILTKEQYLKLIEEHPDLIDEILKNDITHTDIIALGFRKEQLTRFEKLLYDPEYFEQQKKDLKAVGDEAVWQKFFELNTWILGYGLNFIFNSPLDGKKLEQVVKGFTAFDSGKRTDALLKTKGMVSSLCFGEIKTHLTPLLKQNKEPYRSECWPASDELSGGIAQIQKTVQKSIENIKTKTSTKNESGDLIGEELFLYHPKSFLIIGTLSQFVGDNGINEDKYSSFELLRRNLNNPEILTFDEIYERAKFILNNPTSD
jgi:hypothetical protein